jgi:hypothetical protein
MRKLGYLATPYLVLVGSAALPFAAFVACGDDSTPTDSGPPSGRDSGPPTGMDSGPPTGMDSGPPTGMDAGDTPMGDDFTLELDGYMPHMGNLYEVAVLDDMDVEVGTTSGMVPDDGNVTATIPGIIEDGITYTVHWYADLSGNSMCDPPPTDHAWERTGDGAMGLTIMHTHDTMWDDVCGSF